jgi:flagellar basal-body rod protein FlgB
MKLFADSLATLERALSVRADRHTVLAGDLANADTNGFVPVDIDFEAAMTQEGAAVAKESEALKAPPGLDGNQVDVDKTMAALSENGIQYAAAARAASKKLAILRYVASDGAG